MTVRLSTAAIFATCSLAVFLAVKAPEPSEIAKPTPAAIVAPAVDPVAEPVVEPEPESPAETTAVVVELVPQSAPTVQYVRYATSDSPGPVRRFLRRRFGR